MAGTWQSYCSPVGARPLARVRRFYLYLRGDRWVAALALVLAVGSEARAEVPEDIGTLREQALALVNQSREEQGLAPLVLGDPIVEAAQVHADDMEERDYYAHESPEGDTVADRYQDTGGSRWELAAENIARCQGCELPPTSETVEDLHRDWMNSRGHRENILMEGLSVFGFGLAVGEGETYAVQTFAGPGAPRGLQPGEEPVPLAEGEQVARAVQGVNRARERDGIAPVEASEALAEVARALLPPEGEEDFTLNAPEDLFSLLPEGEREGWRSLSVVAGACGGCGAEPLEADIRHFRSQWLDDPRYRGSILDPEATHAGFALEADGQGRKVAVLVMGQRR